MSLLVWNYRGLGNLLTEDQLANLVWAKDLSVVFIVETWTDKTKLERVKEKYNSKICLRLCEEIKRVDWHLFGRKTST